MLQVTFSVSKPRPPAFHILLFGLDVDTVFQGSLLYVVYRQNKSNYSRYAQCHIMIMIIFVLYTDFLGPRTWNVSTNTEKKSTLFKYGVQIQICITLTLIFGEKESQRVGAAMAKAHYIHNMPICILYIRIILWEPRFEVGAVHDSRQTFMRETRVCVLTQTSRVCFFKNSKH